MEGIDRPSYLQFYFVQLCHLIQFYQSSKLRVSVTDIEFVVVVFYLRMHSWYRYVLKSNFALVTSSNSDYIIVLRTNNVQASLLFALSSFVDSFKNEVWLLRFLDGYHLKFKISFWDQSWKRFLANLALKFCKVVWNNHTSYFFLHLAVDPHL